MVALQEIPGSRGLSLLVGLGSALLLTLDPRLVASSPAEIDHGNLMLLLIGIALSLVWGVGLRFEASSPWRWLFHPFAAWPLLVAGWWRLLF